MSKKRDNLFERYIDKAVLGVVGILCLWLLWVFVLGNPYAVEYDGRKLGAGEIDDYIEKQEIQQLLSKLEDVPKSKVYDESKKKSPLFAKMCACSIGRIDESVYWPIPGYGRKVSVDSRIYALPEVGQVGDVLVEHYRSVVHMPVEPVGPGNPYSTALTELGDTDIVTVETTFDVAGLYRGFGQSFSGRMVRRDWQDKNLAKPVFAAVGLQRRRLLDNGSFGDWAEVGCTKVDNLKAMLDGIPEKIDDKHTANLLMVKFDDFSVCKGILQPATYDFAASNEDWLPPKLHKEYAELMEVEKQKLRREQQQLERGMKDTVGRAGGGRATAGVGGRAGATGARGGRAGATGARGGRAGATGARGGRAGATGARGGGGRTNTTSRRGGGTDRNRQGTRGRTGPTGQYGGGQLQDERANQNKKKERKVEDVYADFKKVVLTEKMDLGKMREPLLVWAHDDTVVPGRSYQYRIRVGVFNPLAGRDWFREDQSQFKAEPILWSGYSKETEIVQIPLMMHFFPLDVVAKEEKEVKIKVAKYHNGKWRTEDFDVRPGEIIGKTVQRPPKQDDLWLMGGYAVGGNVSGEGNMEKIDFRTGASLVDVVQTSDWMGVNMLRQRDYEDVLYTKDDTTIAHLAVKTRNWPEELQQEFNRIKVAESEVIQPRGRSQGVIGGQGGSQPGMMRPGMGAGAGRMEMMMMRRGGRLGGRTPPPKP